MTQNDVEPVTIDEFIEKLKGWYDHDHRGFRTMYKKTIQHVVPFPSDTPHYYRHEWKGADFEKLCDFFREWYDLYAGRDSKSISRSIYHGLDYIVKFSWLSYENDYGIVFVTSGPGCQMTADFTRLQGKYMDSEDSGKLAAEWVGQVGPTVMADYRTPPDGKFKTLNQFFIRELKDATKSRPIAAPEDDSVVVASADCVINMIVDQLTETTPIPVKTVTMNVNELLNGSSYASNFVRGTAVSCILMPDTYHWYHAPVAGDVVESHDDIGGLYYGMKDFPDLLNKGNVGYGYDYSMFEDFRRGYLIIDTGNSGYGHVGMVPVGLNSIASVQFEDRFKGITPDQSPVPVEKGEKIGNFQYGGSLNILLFEHGVFPALQLLQGQRIGRLEQRGSERSLGIFSGSWRRPSRRDRL